MTCLETMPELLGTSWSQLLFTVASLAATVAVIRNDLKYVRGDIDRLGKKVDQHNSFGLKLVELETRLKILEKK